MRQLSTDLGSQIAPKRSGQARFYWRSAGLVVNYRRPVEEEVPRRLRGGLPCVLACAGGMNLVEPGLTLRAADGETARGAPEGLVGQPGELDRGHAEQSPLGTQGHRKDKPASIETSKGNRGSISNAEAGGPR